MVTSLLQPVQLLELVQNLVHEMLSFMLSFSISYLDLIKFPYFVDTTERGGRGEKEGEERVTLWISLIADPNNKLLTVSLRQALCQRHDKNFAAHQHIWTLECTLQLLIEGRGQAFANSSSQLNVGQLAMQNNSYSQSELEEMRVLVQLRAHNLSMMEGSFFVLFVYHLQPSQTMKPSPPPPLHSWNHWKP